MKITFNRKKKKRLKMYSFIGVAEQPFLGNLIRNS